MRRAVHWQLLGCCLILGLAGCARTWFEEREPWRHEAEVSCLKSGAVKEGPSVAIVKAIDGPGACGLDYPLRVAALAEPALMGFADEAAPDYPRSPQAHPAALPSSAAVTTQPASVVPAATLACPLVSALDRFVSDSVQPAAARWFGQPVVGIKQISAYSCRGMNGDSNARISEHAFGNALDIAAFALADGRTITVKDGWHGTPQEQGFLHDVHSAACALFTTVLAPGSDAHHTDHMHVDLMRRSSGHVVCQPTAIPGEAAFARAGGRSGGARQAEVAGDAASRIATPNEVVMFIEKRLKELASANERQ
jgi:hypothetical protein